VSKYKKYRVVLLFHIGGLYLAAAVLMTIPECWLQKPFVSPGNTVTVSVSIYGVSQFGISAHSLIKYGKFGLPGSFVPGGGRQRLKYGICCRIQEIWQPEPHPVLLHFVTML